MGVSTPRKARWRASSLEGWEKDCEQAGVPYLHFHDLRRSAVRTMESAYSHIATFFQVTKEQLTKRSSRRNLFAEPNKTGTVKMRGP